MKSYFYIVVPKYKCNTSMNNGKSDLTIKSDNVYALLFLRDVLDIDTGVYLGHMNWKVESTMIDVKEVCDSYEFDIGQNGGVIFNDLMKQFRVNLKLHWGIKLNNRIYKKAFNSAFDKYNRNKIPGMIYNCLLESIDAWVENKKRYSNLVIPVDL